MRLREYREADGSGLLELPNEPPLLVGKDGVVRWNGHAHTDESDGDLTAEEVSQHAVESGINIAQSDHQRAPTKAQKGVTSSAEILTIGEKEKKRAADFLAFGTHEQVQKLTAEIVTPKLDLRYPEYNQYNPTQLSAHQFVREIIRREMYGGLAHYFSAEGLSALPLEEQVEVLMQGRDHLFLEHNAMATDAENAAVIELARLTGIPLIYTGDAHRDPAQYVGNWTGVHKKYLEKDSNEPLIKRLLNAFRRRNKKLEFGVRKPSMLTKALTALQIASRMGWRPTVRVLGTIVRRMMPFRRPPSPEEIAVTLQELEAKRKV